MKDLMKELEKKLEKENKKEFKENKKVVKERAIKYLDEAEIVQCVFTEQSVILNGSAQSVLAGICMLLDRLEESGVPKELLKQGLYPFFKEEKDEEIFEKIGKLLEKLGE